LPPIAAVVVHSHFVAFRASPTQHSFTHFLCFALSLLLCRACPVLLKLSRLLQQVPNVGKGRKDFDGEAAIDLSGRSVAMSANGKRIAIGAARNDGNNGRTLVMFVSFQVDGTTRTQLGKDIDGDSLVTLAGGSHVLRRYRVIIGAIYNDANGSNSGHARSLSWLLVIVLQHPRGFSSGKTLTEAAYDHWLFCCVLGRYSCYHWCS
jgi:hypothetical protein